jgi:hypothetical protein
VDVLHARIRFFYASAFASGGNRGMDGWGRRMPRANGENAGRLRRTGCVGLETATSHPDIGLSFASAAAAAHVRAWTVPADVSHDIAIFELPSCPHHPHLSHLGTAIE